VTAIMSPFDVDARTAAFSAHVRAGGTVEPGDWMPEAYRAGARKFIEMHANSEIMGALPEREWISRAPTLRTKLSLAAKVQDEVGHGHLLYRLAEELGKPRAAMVSDLLAGRSKFHNVFHYPTRTWGDVAVIGWLVDGAALVTQRALLASSYAPYVRVLRRICAEESLHQRHGEHLVLELCGGTPAQRELFTEAVARWWQPILQFFGPPSPEDADPGDEAAATARQEARDPLLWWRFKTRTNESLRQEFLSLYVPKLWDLGVEPPDPDLRWDAETGRWVTGPVDWSELERIGRNEGPMSQTRLAWRNWMHDEHRWVRELLREVAA